MELLPIMTKALLAISGIFLIVLIVSFLISKFRKGKKEVITESYPAERYQYFTNADSGIQSPNSLEEYYYAADNNPANSNYSVQSRNEQSPVIYQKQIIDNPVINYEEPETFKNQWVDYEEETYFENPLRKTSSFNFGAVAETNGNKTSRMTIVNEEPLFKYGWK